MVKCYKDEDEKAGKNTWLIVQESVESSGNNVSPSASFPPTIYSNLELLSSAWHCQNDCLSVQYPSWLIFEASNPTHHWNEPKNHQQLISSYLWALSLVYSRTFLKSPSLKSSLASSFFVKTLSLESPVSFGLSNMRKSHLRFLPAEALVFPPFPSLGLS